MPIVAKQDRFGVDLLGLVAPHLRDERTDQIVLDIGAILDRDQAVVKDAQTLVAPQPRDLGAALKLVRCSEQHALMVRMR